MQPNKQIENKYNELRKKLRLPEFSGLDKELEISDMEETNFLMRMIIRRIAEKLDFYATVLEEILQPDTSNLYAMHETRYFDEAEKEDMYNLYRKLMDLSRQSIVIGLEHNEQSESAFISNFSDEWKELKIGLLAYAKKMKSSWEKKEDVKEDIRYLG